MYVHTPELHAPTGSEVVLCTKEKRRTSNRVLVQTDVAASKWYPISVRGVKDSKGGRSFVSDSRRGFANVARSRGRDLWNLARGKAETVRILGDDRVVGLRVRVDLNISRLELGATL